MLFGDFLLFFCQINQARPFVLFHLPESCDFSSFFAVIFCFFVTILGSRFSVFCRF